MIEAKQAAQIAAKYYEDLVGPTNAKLQVEEVELDDEGKFWDITLGIYDPLVFLPRANEYKIFKISASTGKVHSMKIRIIK